MTAKRKGAPTSARTECSESSPRKYLRVCVVAPHGYTSISIGPKHITEFCLLARGSATHTEAQRISQVVRKAARSMCTGIPRGRFSSAVRRHALAMLRRSYKHDRALEFDRMQFPDGMPARD